MVSFHVGDLFSTYEELKSKLTEYQKQNGVQLYIRHSRNLSTARMNIPNRNFNDALKYYELRLSCIYGGKNYKSKSQTQPQVSRKTATNQQDCQMDLRITVSEDGQNLKIKRLNENHNHPLGLGEKLKGLSKPSKATKAKASGKIVWPKDNDYVRDNDYVSYSHLTNKSNSLNTSKLVNQIKIKDENQSPLSLKHCALMEAEKHETFLNSSVSDMRKKKDRNTENRIATFSHIEKRKSTVDANFVYVNIGTQFGRWQILKEKLKFDSDEQLAEYLLDRLEGELEIITPREEEQSPSFLSMSQLNVQRQNFNHTMSDSDSESENDPCSDMPNQNEMFVISQEDVQHIPNQTFVPLSVMHNETESATVTQQQHVAKLNGDVQSGSIVNLRHKLPLDTQSHLTANHSNIERYHVSEHIIYPESTLVQLGKQYQRWINLKVKLRIGTDEDLAAFLMDHQQS